MTHNEKLDYLLSIINQHPDMIYNDLYKRVAIPISWDEYIRLIKELRDKKCLKYDHYVGIRITEWGEYKLIHSFAKEEKSEWHLGNSLFKMYHAILNKVAMQFSKHLS